MVRMSDSEVKRLEPLAPEERERALAAVERIKRRHAELLAARGGRLFPDSVHELHELRSEREQELS